MPKQNKLDYDNCPPNADATIESIRSLGYDLGIAVSDIIDNSISAGADTIWIYYEWKKADSYISIIDNGKGMQETELIEAMRLGTISPTEKRDEKDLGRFGLGLKTASFSQCRILTVKTKPKSDSYVRKWDLNHVNKVNDWQLLKSTDDSSDKIMKQKLNSLSTGTVVLWQGLDRLITLDDKDEKTLALNGLMAKYQPEGGYEPIRSEMDVLDEVAVIKVVPKILRGKYKIGQGLRHGERIELAKKILERNSETAKKTLDIMGFSVSDNGIKLEKDVNW